jgi:hypothetical protein
MDADEFLSMLMDRLETGLAHAGPISTVLDEVFSFSAVTQLIGAGDCPHHKDRAEKCTKLALDVDGLPSLEKGLEAFVSGELLQGSNQFFCEACGCKRDTLKRTVLADDLAPVLIVTLKRFAFDFERMQKVKVHSRYSFPRELDLGPYTASGADAPATLSADCRYTLTGIVVHTGSADSGHYYSYVRHERWYELNDRTATVVDLSTEELLAEAAFGGTSASGAVKQHSAYLLIYSRANLPEVANILPSEAYLRRLREQLSPQLTLPITDDNAAIELAARFSDGAVASWTARAAADLAPIIPSVDAASDMFAQCIAAIHAVIATVPSALPDWRAALRAVAHSPMLGPRVVLGAAEHALSELFDDVPHAVVPAEPDFHKETANQSVSAQALQAPPTRPVDAAAAEVVAVELAASLPDDSLPLLVSRLISLAGRAFQEALQFYREGPFGPVVADYEARSQKTTGAVTEKEKEVTAVMAELFSRIGRCLPPLRVLHGLASAPGPSPSVSVLLRHQGGAHAVSVLHLLRGVLDLSGDVLQSHLTAAYDRAVRRPLTPGLLLSSRPSSSAASPLQDLRDILLGISACCITSFLSAPPLSLPSLPVSEATASALEEVAPLPTEPVLAADPPEGLLNLLANDTDLISAIFFALDGTVLSHASFATSLLCLFHAVPALRTSACDVAIATIVEAAYESPTTADARKPVSLLRVLISPDAHARFPALVADIACLTASTVLKMGVSPMPGVPTRCKVEAAALQGNLIACNRSPGLLWDVLVVACTLREAKEAIAVGIFAAAGVPIVPQSAVHILWSGHEANADGLCNLALVALGHAFVPWAAQLLLPVQRSSTAKSVIEAIVAPFSRAAEVVRARAKQSSSLTYGWQTVGFDPLAQARTAADNTPGFKITPSGLSLLRLLVDEIGQWNPEELDACSMHELDCIRSYTGASEALPAFNAASNSLVVSAAVLAGGAYASAALFDSALPSSALALGALPNALSLVDAIVGNPFIPGDLRTLKTTLDLLAAPTKAITTADNLPTAGKTHLVLAVAGTQVRLLAALRAGPEQVESREATRLLCRLLSDRPRDGAPFFELVLVSTPHPGAHAKIPSAVVQVATQLLQEALLLDLGIGAGGAAHTACVWVSERAVNALAAAPTVTGRDKPAVVYSTRPEPFLLLAAALRSQRCVLKCAKHVHTIVSACLFTWDSARNVAVFPTIEAAFSALTSTLAPLSAASSSPSQDADSVSDSPISIADPSQASKLQSRESKRAAQLQAPETRKVLLILASRIVGSIGKLYARLARCLKPLCPVENALRRRNVSFDTPQVPIPPNLSCLLPLRLLPAAAELASLIFSQASVSFSALSSLPEAQILAPDTSDALQDFLLLFSELPEALIFGQQPFPNDSLALLTQKDLDITLAVLRASEAIARSMPHDNPERSLLVNAMSTNASIVAGTVGRATPSSTKSPTSTSR